MVSASSPRDVCSWRISSSSTEKFGAGSPGIRGDVFARLARGGAAVEPPGMFARGGAPERGVPAPVLDAASSVAPTGAVAGKPKLGLGNSPKRVEAAEVAASASLTGSRSGAVASRVPSHAVSGNRGTACYPLSGPACNPDSLSGLSAAVCEKLVEVAAAVEGGELTTASRAMFRERLGM